MIFIREMLCALVISAGLIGLFRMIFKPRIKIIVYFQFFLVTFLGAWTGGIWIRPFGPTLLGIHWMPFLIIGFLFALFFTATINPRPPHNRHETLEMLEDIEKAKEMEKITYISLGVFFILLLVILTIAITVRYVLNL
jgi:hypothetical protein